MIRNIHIKSTNESVKEKLLSIERVKTSADDHQLEFVTEFKGVSYVNDSKSIRVTATRNSLEAIETSVVLIIGGNDNECDYSILENQIKQKVVVIVYLGLCNDKILKYCSKFKMLFLKADSLSEAVYIATLVGQSGDVVLFSPACQSTTENYKTRGNEFKKIVNELGA